MSQAFVPPIQPVVPSQPPVGFSKAVSNTAAAVLTTAIGCYGIEIQSSTLNDSDAAVTAKVYVQLDNGSGTQVKAYELVQGESVFVPCQSTSQVKVVTQSGTGWVRGLVYRAVSTGL